MLEQDKAETAFTWPVKDLGLLSMGPSKPALDSATQPNVLSFKSLLETTL